MRKAFTLIELMIVIAIIAIIAAIAIPNLLESRITANEAAAASSLKSGIFASQVQYASGNSSPDNDNDGRHVYACHPAALAGWNSTAASPAGRAAVALAGGPDDLPVAAIQSLDPKFDNVDGQNGPASMTVAGAAVGTSRVGAYDYGLWINSTAAAVGADGAGNSGGVAVTATPEDEAESFWGGIACPTDASGSQARRVFTINTNGSISQSRNDLLPANMTIAALLGGIGGPNHSFGTDPRGSTGVNNPTAVGGSVPYQK